MSATRRLTWPPRPRAGAWPVGVATGSFSRADLQAAGAAVVLSSLAEFPGQYARRLKLTQGLP